MDMTSWRIYSADIEEIDAGYNVITYNMFGRKVDEEVFTSRTSLFNFLASLKAHEPKFQFTEI